MSRLIVLTNNLQGRLSFLKNEENRCPICGTDLTEGDGIICQNCGEKVIIDQNDKKGLKSISKLKTR